MSGDEPVPIRSVLYIDRVGYRRLGLAQLGGGGPTDFGGRHAAVSYLRRHGHRRKRLLYAVSHLPWRAAVATTAAAAATAVERRALQRYALRRRAPALRRLPDQPRPDVP